MYVQDTKIMGGRTVKRARSNKKEGGRGADSEMLKTRMRLSDWQDRGRDAAAQWCCQDMASERQDLLYSLV